MRSRAGRPLSTTLVAALVILFLLVSAGTGVATVLVTRDQLSRQVDAQLLEQARLPGQGPGGSGVGQGGAPPPDGGACDPDRPGLGEGIVMVCSDGVTSQGFVVSSGTSNALDDAARRALLDTTSSAAAQGAEPAGAVTVTLPGLGDYRALSQDDGTGGLVVTGLPLAGVDTAVGDLVRTVLVVGFVGAAVAAAGGAWVVRRSLRPLAMVAGTAREVSAQDLSRGDVDLSVRVDPGLLRPRTEVGQVATAMDSLLEHVGSALEARHRSETRLRTFVADASHELRTPLATIRGYAELAGGRPEDLPEIVRLGLHRIESESTRMAGLVDDLLLLAKLDAGRTLEREPVDLSLLVVESVSDARVVGPGHEWRLDLPPEPVAVMGDAPRLRQVLTNLLANARIHTPEGTRVTTTLRSEPDAVVLEVGDEGPGIPAERQAEVFDRFSRGDASRARAEGSTGLGLSIVRAIVHAHGGEVGVRSRPGRTTFEVRLPMAADDG